MKKYSLRSVFIIFGVSFSLTLSSQNVGINTTGTVPSVNAILDLNSGNSNNLGLIIPNVTLGASLATFNPPIAHAFTVGDKGMMVYNSVATNQPIGYYYWNGATWVSVSGGGSVTAANNGLSLSATTVQLGGSNLIQATNIPLNGNTLSVTGSSVTTNFTTTGQVGIGNAAPNAKAVVDLNNTNNWGLMLPGMTTANLPVITAAQNGLMVFNTTLGCPEYANNSSWVVIGANHGTSTFSYTGAIQFFTVPQCITTITIIASGGAGGSNDDGGGDGAVVTATFTVISGHTLDVVVGNTGQSGIWDGGGGGGGSFVWDASSTNYPMVAAGGGGGGGYTGAGANASTTTTPTTSAGGCGAGGSAGAAGAQGSTTKPGPGGGGGGWNTATGNPAAATATSGQGGVGEPSNFAGGAGATGGAVVCAGGYGGGGGGGYNTTSTYGGGGGGGGYNGGGGGNSASNANQYGGGGGGSGYYNAQFPYTTTADFVNPTSVSATNTGVGSVSITY